MIAPAKPDRHQRYVDSAIDRAKLRICWADKTIEGVRRAAYDLGRLGDWPEMDEGFAKARLEEYAKEAGHRPSAYKPIIAQAWDVGQASPFLHDQLGNLDYQSPGGLEPPKVARPKEWTADNALIWGNEVEEKEVQWLWPGRIPCGFITIFAGGTGVGKTFVAIDIAARKTAGLYWPDGDGECAEPGNVLFIGEDPYDSVTKPRLRVSGADVSKVAFMRWEAMAEFHLSDTEFLAKMVEGSKAELIVIDPPANFLGKTDENSNAGVRAALKGLVAFLADYDRPVALVLITHTTKGGKDVEAVNRIIGSVAWASTSRVAYNFAVDKDNEGHGFMACPKINIGPKPPTLEYKLTPVGKHAMIEWVGDVDKTADEIMAVGKQAERRGLTAETFLIECFRSRREWHSDEIFAEAGKRKISRDAIFEAKKSLDLPKARKIGSLWYWWVPDDWEHLGAENQVSQASQGQVSQERPF